MNRIVSQNDEINGYADKFFKKHKIGGIMERSNFSKEKGFSYIYISVQRDFAC